MFEQPVQKPWTAWHTHLQAGWSGASLMQATSFSVDGNSTGQVEDGNGTLIIHHLNGQRAEEHIFVEGKTATTRRWDAKGKPIN